jgi:ribose 1,5-bisphosphokinase
VVRDLRARYAKLVVVLVSAPKEVLLARLAERGREDSRDMAERLERAVSDDLAPDVVIENVDDPRVGARQLAEILRRRSGSG